STLISRARRAADVFSRYSRSAFISSDSASFSRSKLRATNPSATCTSRSSAPHIFASSATCGTSASSAGPFSSATRMRWYTATSLLRHQGRQPERVREQLGVEPDNHDRGAPRENVDPARIGKRAHLAFVAGEQDERHHRK